MSKHLKMCQKTVIFGKKKTASSLEEYLCYGTAGRKVQFVSSKSDLNCTWQSNRFVCELTNAVEKISLR